MRHWLVTSVLVALTGYVASFPLPLDGTLNLPYIIGPGPLIVGGLWALKGASIAAFFIITRKIGPVLSGEGKKVYVPYIPKGPFVPPDHPLVEAAHGEAELVEEVHGGGHGPGVGVPGHNGHGHNGHGHSSHGHNGHGHNGAPHGHGHNGAPHGHGHNGAPHGHGHNGAPHGHGHNGHGHNGATHSHGHNGGTHDHGHNGHGHNGGTHGHEHNGATHGHGDNGHGDNGGAHGHEHNGGAHGHEHNGGAHGHEHNGGAHGHEHNGGAHGHEHNGDAHGHGDNGGTHGHEHNGATHGHEHNGHGDNGGAHGHEHNGDTHGHDNGLFGNGLGSHEESSYSSLKKRSLPDPDLEKDVSVGDLPHDPVPAEIPDVGGPEEMVWTAAFQVDTTGCSLRLLCHLQEIPNAAITPEETMLVMLFKGATSQDPPDCTQDFPECPLSAKELRVLLHQI